MLRPSIVSTTLLRLVPYKRKNRRNLEGNGTSTSDSPSPGSDLLRWYRSGVHKLSIICGYSILLAVQNGRSALMCFWRSLSMCICFYGSVGWYIRCSLLSLHNFLSWCSFWFTSSCLLLYRIWQQIGDRRFGVRWPCIYATDSARSTGSGRWKVRVPASRLMRAQVHYVVLYIIHSIDSFGGIAIIRKFSSVLVCSGGRRFWILAGSLWYVAPTRVLEQKWII